MMMKKMGMGEDMMDDAMMRPMKDMMMAASKMTMMMKEKGMNETEIMDTMKKMSAMCMDKDMMMEMGKM